MTEPRRVEVDRAHQQLIRQAAARLRHDAILADYRGLPAKHIAFGLALLLDELALQVRVLDDDVRRQAVASARALLEPPPVTDTDVAGPALRDGHGPFGHLNPA